MKEKYGIEGDLYKFVLNENLYGLLFKVKEVILVYLDELYYYFEIGSLILKVVISKYLNVDQLCILFGVGLDEVILMIFRVVLMLGDIIVISEVIFG